MKPTLSELHHAINRAELAGFRHYAAALRVMLDRQMADLRPVADDNEEEDEERRLSPREEAEKAAVFAEFTAAKGKRKPKIHLDGLIDLIDDCNWGEWSCEYSLDDGQTWADGSVQSDGHLIAVETLTDEDGNLIP